ncbi:hypothetical protein I4U23_006173 [Adineta vaga]|nr:hypothetical protein I4U23_006173 [Adineta vaga]
MTTNYQITPPDIKVQPIMHNKSQTRYNSANSKWASPISGILNDDELRLEQEKLEKSKRLEQRRAHLSTILEADKNKFQTELTSQRRSSHESIVQINNPIDPLYSTYEYSYQPEITINSDLQSIELSRTDYLVEEQEDKQSERKRRHQQLKVILQQQMEEFNRMEEEADILNQEEERWYQKQQRLEQFQEQRKQMEENYPIQQNHGRQLLRQHKAKLHKRLKEIQERLVCFSLNILFSLILFNH